MKKTLFLHIALGLAIFVTSETAFGWWSCRGTCRYEYGGTTSGSSTKWGTSDHDEASAKTAMDNRCFNHCIGTLYVTRTGCKVKDSEYSCWDESTCRESRSGVCSRCGRSSCGRSSSRSTTPVRTPSPSRSTTPVRTPSPSRSTTPVRTPSPRPSLSHAHLTVTGESVDLEAKTVELKLVFSEQAPSTWCYMRGRGKLLITATSTPYKANRSIHFDGMDINPGETKLIKGRINSVFPVVDIEEATFTLRCLFDNTVFKNRSISLPQ